MAGVLPAVGQTVVVQFGLDDTAFTRCEAAELVGTRIVLAPFDPLSGEGKKGDAARLIFTRAGQTNVLDAVFTEDAVSSRLTVVLERRAVERHQVDLRVGVTVVGEATPVLGQLLDLSLGGLRAHLPESLPAGLRAFVKISDDRRELVRVIGEVVGMSSTGPSAARDTHVRFVDISDATRARLDALVSGTYEDSYRLPESPWG